MSNVPTIVIPAKIRAGLYFALGVLNVLLLSWDPSFGHSDIVNYGVKVVAGLSALFFGVAGTNVVKDPQNPTP